MDKKTAVQVTTNTRDMLRRIGNMHETYDSVINRLIVIYNDEKRLPYKAHDFSNMSATDMAWVDSIIDKESAHNDETLL